jgi:hypothetical protein
MTRDKIAGFGGRRPLHNIPVQRLHLDTQNPRLPESIQGKSEADVLRGLYDEFDLDELAVSMSNNGYFDEEPLVAIPRDLPAKMEVYKSGTSQLTQKYEEFIKKETTHFTVVEGNRRLSTVMILLDGTLQQKLRVSAWPNVADVIRNDLSVLPVIIYPTRKEVLPYLGIRHITGIKKWDSYAKARYIDNMLNDGLSIDDIENQIGDRRNASRRSSISFNLLEQARDEFDFDIKPAKEDISFINLAVGQGEIKRYLGLPTSWKEIPLKKPVKPEKINELRNLLSWLYGEGKKVGRVVRESRDITNMLSHVVASATATDHLVKTRNLQESYELTDGEENMLKKTLATANTKLEKALGVAHRHKTVDVIGEVEKCVETSTRLLKTVKE